MREFSDMELVREYSRSSSEPAFAELVRRHINLVYSAALRHVGITAQAEEITQAVFVILARRGHHLRAGTVLEAWLYQTTRLTSLSFLRAERRRQFREQEAYMQSTVEQEPASELVWHEIEPLLDEAMMHLAGPEREAIVLRFFKDLSLREAAAGMSVSEAAAQKRVHRALEKLRKFFARRDVSSTAVAIAATLAANAVQAAPSALAGQVTTLAAAKGATISISTATLVEGGLKIMAWTKMKATVAISVALLLMTGTTMVTVHEIQAHRYYAWQTFDQHLSGLILEKLPQQVQIVPTRFPMGATASSPGAGAKTAGMLGYRTGLTGTGRAMGLNCTVEEMVFTVFGEGHGKARAVLATNLPREHYDFVVAYPLNGRDHIRREFERQIGVGVGRERRDMDVFLLETGTNEDGLKTEQILRGAVKEGEGQNSILHESSTAGLAKYIETYLDRPVIDRSSCSNEFNLSLQWGGPNGNSGEELTALLKDRLGLRLVPAHEPVEILVVQRARN